MLAFSAQAEALERIYPKRYHKRTERFTPYARPSPAKVHRIIALEAKRWNIPAYRLERRVGCESTFKWNAANGPHLGLGQFRAETFNRGVASIGTRKVKVKVSRIVRRHIVMVSRDGSRRPARMVRVRRTAIYRGTLPQHPAWSHGWVQLRIMARAIAGLGNVSNSEWACS